MLIRNLTFTFDRGSVTTRSHKSTGVFWNVSNAKYLTLGNLLWDYEGSGNKNGSKILFTTSEDLQQ